MCFLFRISIIFVYLIHYINTQIQKVISIEYWKTFSSSQLFIVIGEERLNIKMQIDLTSQYNWISLNEKKLTQLATSNSSKLINEEIEVLHYQDVYKGKEIEDTFCYDTKGDNKTMSNLRYYLFDREMAKKTGFEAVLSLPFVFKDLHHSLIHFYYNKGDIDNLSFSIIKNHFKHKFILGGIPIEETQNKVISFCNVLNSSSNWECSMTKVTFKNNTEIIDYIPPSEAKMIFNIAEDFIYAPKDFIDIIFEYYISPNFQLYCNYDQEYKRRQLYCSNSYLLSSGTITFAIGNYNYKLNIGNLWQCYEELCYFRIAQHIDKNEWVFGSWFFNNYNVLFDYTEKKVTIYSEKGVTLIGSKKTKVFIILRIITIINCFILIGGIAFNSINKTTINKMIPI